MHLSGCDLELRQSIRFGINFKQSMLVFKLNEIDRNLTSTTIETVICCTPFYFGNRSLTIAIFTLIIGIPYHTRLDF